VPQVHHAAKAMRCIPPDISRAYGLCHALDWTHALGGGVTVSLAQDIHGKSLSNVMLAIELPDPQ